MALLAFDIGSELKDLILLFDAGAEGILLTQSFKVHEVRFADCIHLRVLGIRKLAFVILDHVGLSVRIMRVIKLAHRAGNPGEVVCDSQAVLNKL